MFGLFLTVPYPMILITSGIVSYTKLMKNRVTLIARWLYWQSDIKVWHSYINCDGQMYNVTKCTW